MAAPSGGVASPLPDGWHVHTSRTAGGSVYYHLECECGARKRASARLGELLDHVCAA